MIHLSTETATIIMLGVLLITTLTGFPLAIAVGSTALVVGYLAFGGSVYGIIYTQVYSIFHNYIILALPLFVFMGVILEYSGIADKMYDALFLILGGLRGGLAIVTVLIGTVLAACVGVMSASVSMLAALSLEPMLKRGYDHSLASGVICASGSLGILIPPSIMLVVYGPMARISVGKLFMGAFVPGFLLSAFYCIYIFVRCSLHPKLAPTISPEERRVTVLHKIRLLLVSLIPPIFIVIAVLGTIFMGIAPPTEAAAVGALASLILTVVYRKLNWLTMKNILLRSLNISTMAYLIAGMGLAYTGVFIRIGGGEAVRDALLAVPGGRWATFAIVMLIYFILGFFIEWLGILFIMVPILAPLAPILGFDPLWFGMMICINLQMSFLTPPFAFAIFILRSVCPPELNVTTIEIIRGVMPYCVLIMVALGLCVAFPQLILWLPAQMIG
jgi:tripartite ATP-independent transporter DctM subunit